MSIDPTIVIVVKEGIVQDVVTEGAACHYQVIDLDLSDVADEDMWVGPVLVSEVVPDLAAELSRITQEAGQ